MSKFIPFLLAIFLIIPTALLADVYEGAVIDVLSGDTFVLQTRDNKMLTVRLAEIDAPELDQPLGIEAQNVLSRLINGRVVRVAVLRKDNDGVAWSHVYAGEMNVGYRMVKHGYAKALAGRVNDYMVYSFEEEARKARRGLWGLEEIE